jgi:hypothetical protein
MALWLFILSAFQAPEVRVLDYRCLDNTSFVLRLSNDEAVVIFPDAEYRLPRRSSNLALKYATEKATLYLDGDFAAFIADDRPLPGCVLVRPGAERG